MASRICRKMSQKNLMINQDITLTNYYIIEGCLSLKIMTPKCYFFAICKFILKCMYLSYPHYIL